MGNKWRNVRLVYLSNQQSEAENMERVLLRLCDEIYLNCMPTAVADFIRRNVIGLLLEDISMILKKYGEYDVIYTPNNKSLPAKKSRSMVFVAPDVVLLRQRASIPLYDLISYHQTHGATNIVEKYAAIPVDKQQYVYGALVSFMRSELAENNKR